MNNYLADGKVMEFTAPTGGVTSGTPVWIGSLLVIPAVSAAAGALFNGAVTGVFLLAKNTGTNTGWAEGGKVYATAAGAITGISTGNVLIGVGAAAAGDSDATGKVRLDGVAR